MPTSDINSARANGQAAKAALATLETSVATAITNAAGDSATREELKLHLQTIVAFTQQCDTISRSIRDRLNVFLGGSSSVNRRLWPETHVPGVGSRDGDGFVP